MTGFTAADLVLATGGILTRGDENQEIQCISTDSRSDLSPNGLFVPIRGERTDGHLYIKGAASVGAAAVIYEEDLDPATADLVWVRVPDTKKALIDIGIYLRKRLSCRVACVAGSVGKTTTREMVALALSAGFQTFKTEKNFNSQIGVPIMISRVPEDTEALVLEVGISEFHEMEQIAPVADPDLVVYTNIGVAHIENLLTRENIFREKFKLAQQMKPGSPVIVNGDNDILGKLDDSCGYRIIKYGFGEGCEVRALAVRQEGGRNVFDCDCFGEKLTVRLQMAGQHMIMNALAALAAAHEWQVPLEKAAEKLESFTGFAGRQRITRQGGMTFIEDFYNASPDSMRASLGVLKEMACEGRKIAVLADMKELGEKAPVFHREVGEYAASVRPDLLVCVGELAKELAKGASSADGLQIACFDTNAQAAEYLRKEAKAGDLILFKGSNSMKLGEICEALKTEA